MSSPIHHADDLDPALHYAPPRVRDYARSAMKGSPAAPLLDARPLRPRSTVPRRVPSGDLAMARLQQQLALNPDRVPEPPFDNSGKAWPLARRVFAIIAIAALIASGVVWLPGTTKPAAEAPRLATEAPRVAAETPRLATEAPRLAEEALPVAAETPHVDAPTVPTANRVKIVRVTAGSDMHPLVADTPAPDSQPQPTAPTPPEPSPQIASAGQQAAPPEQKVSTLSSDELAGLLKRGETSLQDGDFASARLLLRRAADAGSADAALALGATFDPVVIKQLGAIGAEADVEQARKWYETASELGSQAASQELAKLAATQR